MSRYYNQTSSQFPKDENTRHEACRLAIAKVFYRFDFDCYFGRNNLGEKLPVFTDNYGVEHPYTADIKAVDRQWLKNVDTDKMLTTEEYNKLVQTVYVEIDGSVHFKNRFMIEKTKKKHELVKQFLDIELVHITYLDYVIPGLNFKLYLYGDFRDDLDVLKACNIKL
jgi:hypothetical protein